MLLCVRLVCSPHNRLCVRTSSSSVPRPALHALGVTRCRQVDSLKQFYGTNRALYDGAAVLDLCSSWTSHFPGVSSAVTGEGGEGSAGAGEVEESADCGAEVERYALQRCVGIGMNAAELKANPILSEWHVQDLNEDKVTAAFTANSAFSAPAIH